jgi:hypothetical protein
LLPGHVRPDYVVGDLKQLVAEVIPRERKGRDTGSRVAWGSIAAGGLALAMAALTIAPGLRRRSQQEA